MNGGYIIIKDDISSKITTTTGQVNYKGAFDYALEVFRTGKNALLSIRIGGLVTLQNITQICSGNMIIWYFATDTDKVTISFNKNNPDVFNVTMVEGA